MARGCAGRPQRLLVGVFVVASVITAVLSLDATVVLLTPVVFATAARLGARAKPHVYGCTHLANSASLLLPVSNLTNLLAFAVSGLAFTRFAGLMALPVAGRHRGRVCRLPAILRADLNAPARGTPDPEPAEFPVFAWSSSARTLAGFAAASVAGINPAWVAAAGAVVLGARALARRRTTVRRLSGARRTSRSWRSCSAWASWCAAVTANGLTGALRQVFPGGTSLLALLAIAALAAAAANLINNLPAVLVLLPLAAPAGAGAVLAVLLGVNIGPNLTYAGSLATLLWRRMLREHDAEPALGEFTRLGLLTVPLALLLATAALWAGLHVIGG